MIVYLCFKSLFPNYFVQRRIT